MTLGEIDIECDVGPNRYRSLDSTAERIRFGVLRLHRWQVHPVAIAPGTFDGYAAYLVKVNYELDLDSGPIPVRWFELGLSTVEDRPGEATILDALPRTASEPTPGVAHSISKNLALVPTNDPASVSAYQPPVTTAVAVHGVGGRQIRWRHTAVRWGSVPPGSFVAWIVLLVEEDRDVQWFEVTARYDADVLDPDHTPFQRPKRLPLTLRPSRSLKQTAHQNETMVPVSRMTSPKFDDDHVSRLFICYAHDDLRRKQRARALGRALLDSDLDVHLDKWDEGRSRDWEHWAIEQVTEADFVLIVASPVCRMVADGHYLSDDHAGIRSEIGIIRTLLQRYPKWREYLLPVVLPGESVANIPLFLRPGVVDYYVIDDITVKGVSGLVSAVDRTPIRQWPLVARVPTNPRYR